MNPKQQNGDLLIVSQMFFTNNICELLNASLKRDYTGRERKPLHQFLKILKGVFIDIAKERKKIHSFPKFLRN